MVIVCVDCGWSKNIYGKVPLKCPKCGCPTFMGETALDRLIDKNDKKEKQREEKKNE
jgi:hypothetical protein